jgi:hypothetical protein
MPIRFFPFISCKLIDNISFTRCPLEIGDLWNRTIQRKNERMCKLVNDWRESTEQKSIVCSTLVSVQPANREEDKKREEKKEEGEKRETKEK